MIARHQSVQDAIIAKYRPRLEGKRVMLFVGGLRPRHVIGAYEDLGMEIIGAGYEFAHNDDYDRTFKELQDGEMCIRDRDESESWLSVIIATGCMANDHLWEDLGLWSRRDLSELMLLNLSLIHI